MSYIDEIEIYNDPIINRKRAGNTTEPYLKITETLTVDGSGRVLLSEVPNKKERVFVKNVSDYLTETVDEELTATLFRVDYPNGVVSFHTDLIGTQLTFSYTGEGVKLSPASRVWVEDEDNKVTTLKDKLEDVDDLILEQKSRVDTLISSTPQPSEVVDLRVDKNGVVYTVAKDHINAIETDIETIEDEINNALTNDAYTNYTSLKDRLDTERANITSDITAIQTEINNAHTGADASVYASLSTRFNHLDTKFAALDQNIESLSDSLVLKVDNDEFNGDNIVSMIHLTDSGVMISGDKVDLVGKVTINDLEGTLYSQINSSINSSDINLTGSLPNSIALDTTGITAYTSDPTKYARMSDAGFYAKNGAFTIERPDGYKSINNGLISHGMAIQSSYPAHQTTAVEKYGSWYRVANNNTNESIDRFTFKHDSQYIHIIATMFVENSITGYMTFHIVDFDTKEVLQSVSITETRGSSVSDLDQKYKKEVIIDLGVPTGKIYQVYWNMYGNVSGSYIYGNISYISQEG